MFSSILTGTSSLTMIQVLVCAGSALACGLITATAYKTAANPSKGFTVSLILMPVLVMMVIMMVNGNLGIGVAVAGSFQLIRFRSLPGRSSDMAAVFLTMADGLACGMGYTLFALFMTVLTVLAAMAADRIGFFGRSDRFRYITVTIPEDLNYTDAITPVMEKYTSGYRQTGIKTVNLGTLYELNYEVKLTDAALEKELLDQIRVRNGNLTVRSSLHAPVIQEL